MRTFTNQTTEIALAFPTGWVPSDITDCTLAIADRAGNTLQAATSAGLYTPAETTSDSYQYDLSVTLATGAGSLSVGDLIRIVGMYGEQDNVVRGYDTTTRLVTLQDALDRDFEEGAAVYRLSAVSTVDLSDTDDYPAGTQLLLTWTPTGTGSPYTELAEIEVYLQLDSSGIEEYLRAMYPRAYDLLKSTPGRLDKVQEFVTDEVRFALEARGMDVTRLRDGKRLTPVIATKMALNAYNNGDTQSEDERKYIGQYANTLFEDLCNGAPIWQDSDNDGIEDDGEAQSYPITFERVW